MAQHNNRNEYVDTDTIRYDKDKDTKANEIVFSRARLPVRRVRSDVRVSERIAQTSTHPQRDVLQMQILSKLLYAFHEFSG